MSMLFDDDVGDDDVGDNGGGDNVDDDDFFEYLQCKSRMFYY